MNVFVCEYGYTRTYMYMHVSLSASDYHHFHMLLYFAPFVFSVLSCNVKSSIKNNILKKDPTGASADSKGRTTAQLQ